MSGDIVGGVNGLKTPRAEEQAYESEQVIVYCDGMHLHEAQGVSTHGFDDRRQPSDSPSVILRLLGRAIAEGLAAFNSNHGLWVILAGGRSVRDGYE